MFLLTGKNSHKRIGYFFHVLYTQCRQHMNSHEFYCICIYKVAGDLKRIMSHVAGRHKAVTTSGLFLIR